MTAKAAAARARAKKLEADKTERMGSTFRQFVAACNYYELKGNFYELPDDDRDEWKDKAKAAAVTLGLRNATNGG